MRLDQTGLKVVTVGQNGTSTLDLMPVLAALNKSTNYECEITLRCEMLQPALLQNMIFFQSMIGDEMIVVHFCGVVVNVNRFFTPFDFFEK